MSVAARHGSLALLILAAVALPTLGWWFARELERHAADQ